MSDRAEGGTLTADTYVAANPETGDRARLVATLPDREIGPTAGIVRGRDDEIIEAFEGEEDATKYRVKFFEGEKLPQQEYEFRCGLLREVARVANQQLAEHSVELVGAWPELMGMGARIMGKDTDGRDYTVDFRYDDEERMANARIDTEPVVRAMVDGIVGEIIKQRARYLHRMTGN